MIDWKYVRRELADLGLLALEVATLLAVLALVTGYLR
jgi:hypothetical protein